MRTLYIDCQMGAAGDMLTAALLELVPDKEAFIEKINEMGIPGVKVSAENAVKCGITGTHVSVKVNGEEEGCEDHHHHHDHDHAHDHHHHHASMHDVEHIIEHLKVSENVKKNAISIYKLIAEAESHAHGKPVTDIHFHEVGTMDAIADVTAVCMLLEKINPDRIVVSPIHVGSGQVKCAHGILPVPAPATAFILKDCPTYGGSILGELCTPTGAALLKNFADEFGAMPVMKTKSIGYGMGKKDFEAANCVRVFLGEGEDKKDIIIKLECNIDDMTSEDIGYAMDTLLSKGALDVYTTSIGMKKNRPGHILTVLCKNEQKDMLVEALFKNTSTLGIREEEIKRYTLQRTIETVNTKFGEIRKKCAKGYGVSKEKFEYEDIAKIARDNDISPEEVRRSI